MKHIFRTLVALVAAVSVGGQAVAQECAPLAPKDQSGQVAFIHQGQSIATSLFEESGCTWPANINGLDGLVLETAGMEGATGNVTATLPSGGSVVLVTLNSYFLDANCAKIANSDLAVSSSVSDAPEAQTVTIPPTAKWFVVSSTQGNATNSVTVTLHSDGKDCVVVKKKKKKKKKRR